MNLIYKGQYPPKNTNVIWIYNKEIRIFMNDGWKAVNESTVVDQHFDANSTHPQSGKAIKELLNSADENLSETSTNIIKNKAVFNQYMIDADIRDVLFIIDKDYYKKQYFTFDFLTTGTFKWLKDSSVEYSIDKGETWSTLAKNEELTITKPRTDVMLRGEGIEANGNGFETACRFNIFGNIMSLIAGENFEAAASISTSGQFAQFFKGSNVVDAGNLILPATTLASNCYTEMFMNCVSLTKAPYLPATTLVSGCYISMFEGCSILNDVRCNVANYESGCTTDWLKNVAATGKFERNIACGNWPINASGIPENWVVTPEFIDVEVVLPNTIVYNQDNVIAVKVQDMYIPAIASFEIGAQTYSANITTSEGGAVTINPANDGIAYGNSVSYEVTASKGTNSVTKTGTLAIMLPSPITIVPTIDNITEGETAQLSIAVAQMYDGVINETISVYAGSSATGTPVFQTTIENANYGETVNITDLTVGDYYVKIDAVVVDQPSVTGTVSTTFSVSTPPVI